MSKDLKWITYEKLVELAKKRFRNAHRRVHEDDYGSLSTEPTLVILRSALAGGIVQNQTDADRVVAVTKTLQNAVGLFHQDVLGSADGWESLGGSGGVLDIKSKEPVALVGGRTVIAEVKMRYNTIKGSDEKKTYDKIKDMVDFSGGSKKNVGYIFQIVPKNRIGYDEPWQVSGRIPVDYVRAADGVTAYHIVTGEPDAYFQLMKILPEVIEEAIGELDAELGNPIATDNGGIDIGQPATSWPTVEATSLFTEENIQELVEASMPERSILSAE